MASDKELEGIYGGGKIPRIAQKMLRMGKRNRLTPH